MTNLLTSSPRLDAVTAVATGGRLWRRLLRHGGGRVGVALAFILALAALIGPWLTTDPDVPDYTNKLQPPSGGHLLGTDLAGRDLLARTFAGARMSLGAALLVMAIVTIVGLVVGVVAGSAGGVIDTVLTRVMDVLLGIPGLVLTLAIVGVLGPSFFNLVFAMAVTGWAGLAKVARAHTRGAGQRPDVIAARMAGAGPIRIAFGHVLPGVVSLLVVAATLRLGDTVVALAGLSFLGLGAQPPTAEWGRMLSDARETLSVAPFQIIGPGVALMLTVLASTLIADALRDLDEPENRR